MAQTHFVALWPQCQWVCPAVPLALKGHADSEVARSEVRRILAYSLGFTGQPVMASTFAIVPWAKKLG